MSHLPLNKNHWFTASPFTLAVTVHDTPSADLSTMEWRIDGKVAVTTGITAADNADDEAVVSVPVTAGDMSSVAAGVHRWQLQASVSGSGPRVIAHGDLMLDPLAT